MKYNTRNFKLYCMFMLFSCTKMLLIYGFLRFTVE